MRVLLSKFCEYASQQQNGRHTMMGIFDNIVAPQFPIQHPPFFLCIQLEFEPPEANSPVEITARLIDEDGNQLLDVHASGQIPSDPTGGPTRLFIQFHMPSMRFEKPGDYRLDVEVGGHKIGEERLPVVRREV